MKQFIFLSGIPRSGSQVLSSLLNQHPLIYSTTTSPVADLISVVNESWPNLSKQIVNPDSKQHGNIIRSVLHGAYEHIEKPIIIDKNRLWPRFIPILLEAFDTKPKIICTIRDIPSVLASYILLIRKNNDKVSFIDRDLIELKLPINDKNRCKIIWERYVQHPYTSLRMGYNSNQANMLFLSYEEIVNDSQRTFNRVCEFIGIESNEVNPSQLQKMDEHDEFHGGLNGLHEVRQVMKRISPPPEQVIGHDLTLYYSNMKLDFWNKNKLSTSSH